MFFHVDISSFFKKPNFHSNVIYNICAYEAYIRIHSTKVAKVLTNSDLLMEYVCKQGSTSHYNHIGTDH